MRGELNEISASACSPSGWEQLAGSIFELYNLQRRAEFEGIRDGDRIERGVLG